MAKWLEVCFINIGDVTLTKHLDLIPPGDDPQQELTRLTGLGAAVLDHQSPGAG